MPPWCNPWLLVAMALSFGLHFLILYVPLLAGVFSIVPLSLNEWALVVLFAFPVVLIDEVLKFVGRTWVHPRSEAPVLAPTPASSLVRTWQDGYLALAVEGGGCTLYNGAGLCSAHACRLAQGDYVNSLQTRARRIACWCPVCMTLQGVYHRGAKGARHVTWLTKHATEL